tara:strand:- start:582 stop:803 length:222 start_codon:yes stop_codon:yes gene_type:complete
MAKTITIEWTDAQWELILAHFPQSIGGFDAYDGWSEGLLAHCYQRRISREVVQQMLLKHLETSEFDNLLDITE